MFIKIGGVHGVGKTTVAEILINDLISFGHDAGGVHGADIMARILGVTMDELRAMPEKRKNEAREKMFREVYKTDLENPDKIIIRDAHFCIRDVNDGKIQPVGLRDDDRNQLKAIVLLTAPEEEILKRRNDHGRIDRSLDMDIIREEMENEVKVARQQAEELGIPIFEIENAGQSPEVTTKNVVWELTHRGVVSPERTARGAEMMG